MWVTSRERLEERLHLFPPSLICFDDLGHHADGGAARGRSAAQPTLNFMVGGDEPVVLAH